MSDWQDIQEELIERAGRIFPSAHREDIEADAFDEACKVIAELKTLLTRRRESHTASNTRILGLEERIAELKAVAKFQQVAFGDVNGENRIFIKEVEEKNKRITDLEACLGDSQESLTVAYKLIAELEAKL